MKRILHGAVTAFAAVALSGGLLAATTLNAAAAATNVAYAAAASGTLAIPPVAEASFPGTSPVTLAHLSVLGLTASVVTDQAASTSASSTVANIKFAGVLGLLAAASIKAVSSSCSYNSTSKALTGSVSIIGGTLSGLIPISLPTKPAPNTTISVLGLATITLNKQVNSGGTLEVDALSVSVLGSTETVTVGTSICNAAVL